MMTIDDIVSEYCNYDDGEHTRKVGRYYSSEISSIAKGYVRPNNFFKKKTFDLQSARRISSGRILETGFEEMLKTVKVPHEYNPKFEIQVDNFVVVCKPDFIFPKFVIETKFPSTERSWEYLMDSYKYQLQAEHLVTGKDVYLGRFVLERGNEFNIRFRRFLANDKIWEEAVEILRKFDSSLKIYLQKYGNNEQNNSGVEGTTENKL